jgi:glycosyltransferase involved in cell wall biosynthesis
MDQNLGSQKTVTVAIPAFNAEKYIAAAIESVLTQTYKNFVLLVIDDGSTDSTPEIIRSFKDPRIELLVNTSNIGLVGTLNKAIVHSQTEYLLRMDADDIARADRIEKQVAFMDANPQVWVSSGQARYFGQLTTTTDLPLNHNDIKATLLFGNALVHPAAILRIQKLKAHNLFYSESFRHIEDYELWTRVALSGQLANLQDVLIDYRFEGQNITSQQWAGRKERINNVHSALLSQLGITPSHKNLELHLQLAGNALEHGDPAELYDYLRSIKVQNRQKEIYDEAALAAVLAKRWEHVFFKYADTSFMAAVRYFFAGQSIKWKQLRFLLGSLFKGKKS